MIINNLIEMHCHILPGIDDGSPDVQTSLAMIEQLQAQGAKAIVLTPHYYSDSISLEDFVSKRDDAFEQLKSALSPGSPKLIPAAEVYISKYLMNNQDLSKICIGNSKYALIEHPFSCDFSQDCYDRLLNLNYEFGITPILAHIERYNAFMSDGDLLDEYIDMGCLAQVNINSFCDAPRSIRKKLIKYIKNDRIHLIGTDCHNLSTRPPKYADGVKEIISKCGEDVVEQFEYNAAQIIKNA